jgi:hypothetical protein
MKKLVAAVVFCVLCVSAQAQNVYNSSGRANARKQASGDGGFDIDRLIVGGSLNLWLGSITNVGLAPMVGYRITDNFAAGLKVGYNYYRYKDAYSYQNFQQEVKYYTVTQNIYSAGIWARHILWENIFVHGEVEANIYDYYDGTYSWNAAYTELKFNKKLVTAPSILLGLGFKQPLSDRTSFTATILYDVLQDKYSLYGNQIDFRFGVLVGF